MNSKGRDEKFLSYFWDIASNDKEKRVSSSVALLEFVQSNKLEDKDSDLNYTFHRLIKGLSSSRDSARKGFSNVLCELLIKFDFPIESVLNSIDQSTQITGSLKGNELRDVMFGKLFGYLSIIRSGRIRTSNELSSELSRRLCQLLKMKKWIREVVAEALLYQIFHAEGDVQLQLIDPILELIGNTSFNISEEDEENKDDDGDMDQEVSTTIADSHTESVVREPKSALAPWQLMLSIGLSNLKNKKLSKIIKAKLSSSESVFSFDKLAYYSNTFLSSTMGFPKIHRIWDYVLSQLIPMNQELELSQERLSDESSFPVEKLDQLVSFLDQFMIPGSKEKRCVAFSVAVRKLLPTVPSKYLGKVLSHSFLSSIVSSRANKRHILYDFSGGLMEELVQQTGANEEAKREVVVSIIVHIGSNFDIRTGTKTLWQLMQGLSYETTLQLVQSLTSELAPLAFTSSSIHASSLIDSYLMLGKVNNDSAQRSIVYTAIAPLMIRLALMSSIRSVESLTEKESKKKSKKSTKKSITVTLGNKPTIPSSIESLLQSLDTLIMEHGDSSSHIQSYAKQKFLAFMSDMQTNFMSIRDPSVSVSASVYLWQVFSHFVAINSLQSGAFFQPTLTEEEDQKRLLENVSSCLERMEVVLQTLYTQEKGHSDANIGPTQLNKLLKLKECLDALVVQSTFHAFFFGDIDAEMLEEFAKVLPSLLQAVIDGLDANEEDSSREVEEVAHLLDFTIEIFSMSSDTAIKGMRDLIKRTWSALCGLDAGLVGYDVVNNLVNIVIDEEEEEDISENDGSNDDDDDDEEEDNDDEEFKSQKIEENGQKKAKKNKKSISKRQVQEGDDEGEQHQEEEEEEEDIVLSHEDALDMMLDDLSMEENDLNDEDEEDINESQMNKEDEALANMIQLRKQNRKEGLLQALKHQMVLRSRSIDILEVLVSKLDNGDLLFPLFHPLLKCLNKSLNSSLIQSIAEGKSFCNRLQNLIEQKLCKQKLSYAQYEDESSKADIEADVLEEFSLLANDMNKWIRSSNAQMRNTTQSCWIALSRMLVHSSFSSAQSLLIETVRNLFDLFIQKKNSHLNAKLFEELFLNRFMDFYVPHVWTLLVEGLASCKQAFVTAELSRFVDVIIKRVTKQRPPHLMSLILEHIDTLFGSLLAIFEQKLVPTDPNENAQGETKGLLLSSKRLKFVLQLNLEVLSFLTSIYAPSKEATTPLIKAHAHKAVGEYLQRLSSLLSDSPEGDASQGLSSWLRKENSSTSILQLVRSIQGKLELVRPLVNSKAPSKKTQSSKEENAKKRKQASQPTEASHDEKKKNSKNKSKKPKSDNKKRA